MVESNLKIWNDFTIYNKSLLVTGCILPFFIFITSKETNSKLGAAVPWRPPSLTYIIAWVAICICLSLSWALFLLHSKKDTSKNTLIFIGFLLMIILSILWIYMYKIDKRNGVAVFVALLCTLCTLIPNVYDTSPSSTGFLMPLLVWAVFQLAVNCAEITYDKTDTPKTG